MSLNKKSTFKFENIKKSKKAPSSAEGSNIAKQNHFPGFDVLGEVSSWDNETKAVVLSRGLAPKPLRFFTVEEEATCRALLNRLLALEEGPTVAVIEGIDSRLQEERIDGWYYEEMGPDGDAWRKSLKALEEQSKSQSGISFHLLEVEKQNDLLESIRLSNQWAGLPAGRLWSLWMRYACTELYSFPQIWNEIGFGGPAYPRGYKALGIDRLEPWEVPESDSIDPVPWASRIEKARDRHLSDGNQK